MIFCDWGLSMMLSHMWVFLVTGSWHHCRRPVFVQRLSSGHVLSCRLCLSCLCVETQKQKTPMFLLVARVLFLSLRVFCVMSVLCLNLASSFADNLLSSPTCLPCYPLDFHLCILSPCARLPDNRDVFTSQCALSLFLFFCGSQLVCHQTMWTVLLPSPAKPDCHSPVQGLFPIYGHQTCCFCCNKQFFPLPMCVCFLKSW